MLSARLRQEEGWSDANILNEVEQPWDQLDVAALFAKPKTIPERASGLSLSLFGGVPGGHELVDPAFEMEGRLLVNRAIHFGRPERICQPRQPGHPSASTRA